MITIISATNRPNSNTAKIAKHYHNALAVKTGGEVRLLSLEEVADGMYNPKMYSPEGMGAALRTAQENTLIPSDRFVFVSPEYNGSVPGALKLFIDALSIHRLKETFGGKKALLVGVAVGRAGNLRGLEHLTGMLCHIGMHVHPNRLPISGVNRLLDEAGEVSDEGTINVISKQLDAFLSM